LEDSQNGQSTTNTQTNANEQCKSITTRNGIVIRKVIGDNLIVCEEKKDEERKFECDREEKEKRERECTYRKEKRGKD